MMRILLIILIFTPSLCYPGSINVEAKWDSTLINKKLKEIFSTSNVDQSELLAWYSLSVRKDNARVWISDSILIWVQFSKNSIKKWALLKLRRSPKTPDWKVEIHYKYTSWKIFQETYTSPPDNKEVYEFLESWPWKYNECRWQLQGSVMVNIWSKVIGEKPTQYFELENKDCTSKESITYKLNEKGDVEKQHNKANEHGSK